MSFYTLAQMIAPKAPMDQRLRLSPEFLVVVPDQAESAFKERSPFSKTFERGIRLNTISHLIGLLALVRGKERANQAETGYAIKHGGPPGVSIPIP